VLILFIFQPFWKEIVVEKKGVDEKGLVLVNRLAGFIFEHVCDVVRYILVKQLYLAVSK
jgi:hypothetical protein